MVRQGDSKQLAIVGRAGLAVVAIFFAISIYAPSAAHASGCEDSWTNTAGGSWLEGANWSKGKAPAATEEACITEPGTYTVTLTNANPTVKSLVLGGSSGTQTLAVDSTCSNSNETLTTTGGLEVEAHGALTLGNAETCGYNVFVVGPLTNLGSVVTEAGKGGQRELQGSFLNKGTLQIGTSATPTSFNGAKATLTNEGAISLSAGAVMVASNESAIANDSGGSIAAESGAYVYVDPKGSFTEGAGTTSGGPVYVESGSIVYTGSGASTVAARGTDSLSGNISAGQKLEVQSTCSQSNALVNVASSLSSAGTITMENADSCGYNTDLAIASGQTLTSSGTISAEEDHGGNRQVQGNVVNSGTLEVNQSVQYDGKAPSLLTNEGTIDVASTKQLLATEGSSVTNSAGTIASTGTGDVYLKGGTFTQGAGKTSGEPVYVESGSIVYTGSGASMVAARATDSLSGNIAAGQKLELQSTCSQSNEQVNVAASLSSAGTITMENAESCGYNTDLAIAAGQTLTSSGTISAEVDHGGSRQVQGNVVNSGTLDVNQSVQYDGKAPSLLTNEGTIEVASAKQLLVTEGSSVTNAGGTIVSTGSGDVYLKGGTLTEGAGKTSGEPVYVESGSIVYTGSGASTVAARATDSLSGNIAAGQKLELQSTCSQSNERLNIASSLSSAGTITMENAESCGYNTDLAVAEGQTLTSSGTISAEEDHGGSRQVQGSLVNRGTVSVKQTIQYDGEAPSLLTNEGTIEVASGKQLLVTEGSSFGNAAGTVVSTGSGDVYLKGGTLTEGAGKTTGEPIYVEGGAIEYAGTGASTIAARGSDTLTGSPKKGQTLELQSTCSQSNEQLKAGSFTNEGTIVLTNAESCGYNVDLALSGGTLTNKGTIAVEYVHGGNRVIEGSLKNEKTVTLFAGETLKVTGAYTQGKKGTLSPQIAGPSSFGKLAVTGTAAIEGKLKLKQIKPFLAKAGEKFAILTSAGLTGTFAKVSGNKIKHGGEYKPTYSGTGVTLEAT